MTDDGGRKIAIRHLSSVVCRLSSVVCRPLRDLPDLIVRPPHSSGRMGRGGLGLPGGVRALSQ